MRQIFVAVSVVVLLVVVAVLFLKRPVQNNVTVSNEPQKQVADHPSRTSNVTPPSRIMARIDETHEKVVHYTVSIPVYETHTKLVNYTVMRPVTETLVKNVPYTVMKAVTTEHTVLDALPDDDSRDRVVKTVMHIPEAKMKPVVYTVTKMVPEQRKKSVTYQTCRMVTEKRQKTVQYTTSRFVPAAELQNELEQQRESEIDPIGSNRCLN